MTMKKSVQPWETERPFQKRASMCENAIFGVFLHLWPVPALQARLPVP